MPVPTLVRAPLAAVSEITPAKAAGLVLLPPTVSVFAAVIRTRPPEAPPPLSEPMLALWRTSRVAPETLARVTAELSPRGPAVGVESTPVLILPSLIVVGPE